MNTDRTWQVRVDGAAAVDVSDREPDLRRLPDGSYHLITAAGRSIPLEVLELDERAKRLVLRVDGQRHEVSLLSPLDQLIARLGLEANPKPVLTELRAPMPGLVLRVEVEAGRPVEAGDTLLVLEAMKMENAIKAPVAAVVSGIDVAQGQAVDKGALLVRFEY